MDGYLMISASAFATMSKASQAEALKAGLQYNETAAIIPATLKDNQNDELPPLHEDLVSLTEHQCRALIAPPMDEKTYKVAEVMAGQPTHTFDLADVAVKAGVSVQNLKGPLSGLTQRTRAITKKKAAVLIDRYEEKRRDANGVFTGQTVRLNPKTYASLKAVFKSLNKTS